MACRRPARPSRSKNRIARIGRCCKTAVTNQKGRILALYPAGKALEKGTYRVTFLTGEWFKQHKIETFFPEIPVIFMVDGSVPHYHVPLLLSPFGYSTYRGK